MHEPLAIVGGILIAVLLLLGFLVLANGLGWLVVRFEVRALRRRGRTVGYDEAAKMLESNTHVLVLNRGGNVPERVWLVPSCPSDPPVPLRCRFHDGGLLLDCGRRERRRLEARFEGESEILPHSF